MLVCEVVVVRLLLASDDNASEMEFGLKIERMLSGRVNGNVVVFQLDVGRATFRVRKTLPTCRMN